MDDDTRAAIPGGIKISSKKYLDYIGIKGVSRLKYNLLLLNSNDFLFKNFANDEIIYDYLQTSDHFKFGCVNPSIILNTAEGHIATFTSLTSYGDCPTPVIKISKEPLHLIRNVFLQNGQKAGTVSLYFRNPDDDSAPVWIDFDPKLALNFTEDIQACEALKNRNSAAAWECLEIGLAQIKDSTKTGLYAVDVDPKLIKSAY